MTLIAYHECKPGRDVYGRRTRQIRAGPYGEVVATITNLPRSPGEKQWYVVAVPGLVDEYVNDNLIGARNLAYTLLQHKEAGVRS